MAFVSVLGLAVFLVATTVVGVRLLLMARRTRRLPEVAIGLAFLLVGALGYFPVVVVINAASFPAGLVKPVLATGLLALNLGAGALWWFAWYVFRRGDAWSGPVCGSAVALLAVVFGVQMLGGGVGRESFHGGWYWLGFVTRALAFAWCGVASLHYHVLMRRRLRLGLVSRTDTNVFLLWGIGTSAAFLIFALTALGLLTSGPQLPWPIVLTQSLAALTAAGAVWLTFFPPRWYLGLLEEPRATVPNHGSV